MDTNFEICKVQWKELSVDAKHVLWPTGANCIKIQQSVFTFHKVLARLV